MNSLSGYIGIALTIFFTVYSQVVIKWQISEFGVRGESLVEKIVVLLVLLLKPWVFSAVVSTFLAGISWMFVLSKLEHSYAYPFVSLTYVIILFIGVGFFNEVLNLYKVLGVIFIVLGLVIASQG